jgi:hypothetical protein
MPLDTSVSEEHGASIFSAEFGSWCMKYLKIQFIPQRKRVFIQKGLLVSFERILNSLGAT